MSGGGGGKGRELDQTPTWAVALVCLVIVVISLMLEKLLHKIGHTFERKKKRALVEALEKIKGELMVLGFISLLLTFGQSYIAKICIPEAAGNTMLPCLIHDEHVEHQAPGHGEHAPSGEHGEHAPPEDEHQEPAEAGGEHHRRLLWSMRRVLSGHAVEECKEGLIPLISLNGLHQLHIFIFFLAVFHVIYGAITMALGRMKIRGWKEWEMATAQDEAANDPSRYRLTKETSFVKENTSFMTQTPVLFYSVCFFRQFFRSVRRADYLAMRHGFISVHLAPGSKFDFQKYIKRSLEDDFKVVVGINLMLWCAAVLYLLLNVHGWHAMIWLSMMPLVTILSVGTKLQAIIGQMAIEIQERHAVVQGIPLVQVSDRHFWFSKPKLVLHLIHLTLFQNAFEITYFFWISYEFGIHSCFHSNFYLAVARVCLGFGVQFMCSYITLPLYALVTQMGSTMKRSIFDEQTSKALMQWHRKAKHQAHVPKAGGMKTTTLGGGSPDDSAESSPTHPGDSDPASTGQMANIVASVDIPGDTASADDGRSKSTDLLTGRP
ncbi:PREDICTED: MLO-like protein 9 [Ipomoea nil]|uniref:MLO-like protein 9 n=1 Tax=Ipomoea nil TaxID=35883 RepID=UPI00090106AB|nr:PREDICTED: MLO-like protein 9 [Ipomoea nil]